MKKKSLEKEEEIYRVVLEITAEVGLAGLKMSDIAKQAGLAHGTVYIYFKNKRDLINSLFKKVKTKAAISIGTGKVIDGNFFEILKELWKGYIAYLIHNQQETHFLRQCMESPFLEESSKEVSDESRKNLITFFEKGKQEGYVKGMDTELLMSVFSGLAKDVVDKINNDTLNFSDQLITDSFDLCWHAIRR